MCVLCVLCVQCRWLACFLCGHTCLTLVLAGVFVLCLCLRRLWCLQHTIYMCLAIVFVVVVRCAYFVFITCVRG
jgi:hypothetical protein